MGKVKTVVRLSLDMEFICYLYIYNRHYNYDLYKIIIE